MHVTVRGDLVPGGRDLADAPGHAPRHHAVHEERRVPAQPVELLEDRRGRHGIGTVVEGQRKMAAPAETKQRRRGALRGTRRDREQRRPRVARRGRSDGPRAEPREAWVLHRRRLSGRIVTCDWSAVLATRRSTRLVAAGECFRTSRR